MTSKLGKSQRSSMRIGTAITLQFLKKGQNWEHIELFLTCDEWPATSWIEGADGSTAYCVHEVVVLQGTTNGGIKADSLQSEQNWQGDPHNFLVQHILLIQTIIWSGRFFKFDFKYVDDAKIDHATRAATLNK